MEKVKAMQDEATEQNAYARLNMSAETHPDRFNSRAHVDQQGEDTGAEEQAEHQHSPTPNEPDSPTPVQEEAGECEVEPPVPPFLKNHSLGDQDTGIKAQVELEAELESVRAELADATEAEQAAQQQLAQASQRLANQQQLLEELMQRIKRQEQSELKAHRENQDLREYLAASQARVRELNNLLEQHSHDHGHSHDNDEGLAGEL